MKKQELVALVESATSLRSVCLAMGLENTPKGRFTTKSILTKHGLLGKLNNKLDFTEADDDFSPSCPKTRIKERLLDCGHITEYKCSICGNNGEWENKHLVLQLDHINGDNMDNRPVNLRFICPNCHSQTETFSRNKH